MKTQICRYSCLLLVTCAYITMHGCATPDFKPFATETAALGGAIAAEQAEVVSRFELTVAKLEIRDSKDIRLIGDKKVGTRGLNEQRDTYRHNATALNSLMDVAVNYSNALVELAAAGETGPKAVDSLAGTLKGFSTALSFALPVASIPSWAGELAKEIAQGVRLVQAQDSLAKATKIAHPTIEKMANAIVTLYGWPQGPQAAIEVGLQSLEEGVLTETVGKNRIAFYNGLSVKRITLSGRTPQTRIEYFFGEIDDRIANLNPAAGICGVGAFEPIRNAKGEVMKDASGKPILGAKGT